MARRQKITAEISLFISRDYDALERHGSKREAIGLIKSDVLEEFGEDISKGSIRLHVDNTPEKLREKRREYRMETAATPNPERLEFSKTFEGYQKGIRKPINPDNRYLRTLMELDKHDFPIKGRHLAQDLNETSVSEQLAVLKRYGLIEHPALQKNEASSEGKKFLKSLGLIP